MMLASSIFTGDSGKAALPLLGRRVQISGSANEKTDQVRISYAHEVVRILVKGVLTAGGGIVTSIGREPRPDGSALDAPSLIFDWTALEAARECLQEFQAWPAESGLPIVVASSEKAVSEIPDARRPLYEELLSSGFLQVVSIMPGSRAAALVRQRQAVFGDALVILGGGTGVEHLAQLYLALRKPVVPLDLDLGANREDGTGGSMRLAKESIADPARFICFCPPFQDREGAALAGIATRNGIVESSTVASRIIDLLTKTTPPTAFYVRLLNTDHAKFPIVESFFREVVDPVVDEARMRRVEIGTDRSNYAFMNVGIFESLHFSSVAIVDVTGERPNCFIELGYALRGNRVLVMAEEGTRLPFDQEMIPCHFWRHRDSVAVKKIALIEFWNKYINRPPIVKMS